MNMIPKHKYTTLWLRTRDLNLNLLFPNQISKNTDKGWHTALYRSILNATRINVEKLKLNRIILVFIDECYYAKFHAIYGMSINKNAYLYLFIISYIFPICSKSRKILQENVPNIQKPRI